MLFGKQDKKKTINPIPRLMKKKNLAYCAEEKLVGERPAIAPERYPEKDRRK